MELTAQTLREVEFREKLRGYHPDDVDDFLEEAAVALDDLLERLRVAEAARGGEAAGGPMGPPGLGAEKTGPTPLLRPEPALANPEVTPPVAPAAASGVESSPAPPSVTEDTLRRTLVLAQQTADAAIADAQESATRIVEEAQAEARRLTESAEARATELRAQAQARAAQSMAELEEQRSGLEHEVVALRSWAVQQRDRLRDALTDQVRSLDIWLATSAPSDAAVGPKADASTPSSPGADTGEPTGSVRAGPDPTGATGPSRPGAVEGAGGEAGVGPGGDRLNPAGTPDPEAPPVRSNRPPFSAAPSTPVPPLAPGRDESEGTPSSAGLVDHEAEPGRVEDSPAPDAPVGDGPVAGDDAPPRGFFRGR